MALTGVREASLLQLANMLSDASVASTFENFSIGLIEKTLSVFNWPRNGCDALPLCLFFLNVLFLCQGMP